MSGPDRRPFNKVTNCTFVDADTGCVVEEFKMREFYEWDDRTRRHVLVRSYTLDMEPIVNPGFKG